MPDDGTYTAVVDRFEEDLAVLLLEADGETVGEIVVEQNQLPEAGCNVNAVLVVELIDEELVDVTYQDDATTERTKKAQRRFDELSKRPPSSDDNADPS